MPMRCCTRMRSGDCTRCSGCNGKLASMEVEDFHGQNERGVKQEWYACFTLIAMTRLFANHGKDHLNGRLPNDGKSLMQTHFKHGLAAVAANIESLLLQQASALRETVARIVGEIVRCRHRHRQPANGIKNQRITKSLTEWQSSLNECHWTVKRPAYRCPEPPFQRTTTCRANRLKTSVSRTKT